MILESQPGNSLPRPALHAPIGRGLYLRLSLSKKSIIQAVAWHADSSGSPDYFTEEEAVALVDAAPSYPTSAWPSGSCSGPACGCRRPWRCGVSEALALRRVDLRLDQDPPIIVVRADSPGNKGQEGPGGPCTG